MLNGHMPTAVFQDTQTYTVIDCPTKTCGVQFAISALYQKRRHTDHRDFYCPNGHVMSYGHETDAEKEAREQRERANRLAKTLERRDRELTSEMARVVDERKAHAVTKGKLTKTRNRAAKGVCPAPGCKRSFVDVARHVAHQHPELSA